MGNDKKLSARSRMLEKVGYFDIRQVYERDSKNVITSSTISIFHGKKLIKDGFKNKEEAILSAKNRLS